MTPITINSDWRHLGAVPYSVWKKKITQAGGSPGFADQRVWAAYGDDSALALAQSNRESSYASNYRKIPESYRDPLNLQVAGKGVDFSKGGSVPPVDAYVAGAVEWKRRLYSADYKDGVYTKTKTIFEMVSAFAPKSDGNDPLGYSQAMVAEINTYGFDPPVTTPSTPPEGIPAEGEPVATVTFGKVPKPPSVNKFIPSSQNMAWDNLGKRAKVPNGFVLHRMEGSLEGTNTYFRGFRNAQQTGVGGLTNIGIGVAAMDGAALAGVVYEWNTPELDTEDRAGWANGQVKGAYGDGLKYVNLFGISAVNRDLESCEISGQLGTPLDEKSRTAIAARLAWRADQYGAELAKKGEQFDYSTFPYIPSQDRNFTIWHQEFTIGTGKTCPGPVVMAETDDLIARAKVILEQYQTGSVAPQPEPEPTYADAAPVEKGSRDLNGYIFLAPGGKTVQIDTYPVKYADAGQPPTGPKLAKGTKIAQEQISHYVVGTDGKQWVVLTGVPGVKDGSRFPATALIADAA